MVRNSLRLLLNVTLALLIVPITQIDSYSLNPAWAQTPGTPTPEPELVRRVEEVTHVQVINSVRVRSEAGTSGGNATVLRSAQVGEEFEVRSEVEWVEADGYTWVPVIVDGQDGWIAEQGFVSLVVEQVQVSIPDEAVDPGLITPLSDKLMAFTAESNELPLPVAGHVRSSDPETIQAMQTAGMTWVKLLVGVGNLDSIRNEIEIWHNAGFKVLLSIVGDTTQLAALGEDYYHLFAQQLGAVAALAPDAIEVWREMNSDRSWTTGEIDPEAYASLLRQAHHAIKSANGDVLVITGALIPTVFGETFGNMWNDDRYYQGMADAGVAEFADCIGVRYDEGAVSPSQTEGDSRGEVPTYYLAATLERATTPFADQNIPFCLTSLGYLSTEGYEQEDWVGVFSWSSTTSASDQAAWLRDAILAASNDGRIALVAIWNVDFPGSGFDAAGGWALIRPDGACPACEAIGTLRQ